MPLLNLAAIIHRRSGDSLTAQALYRYALKFAPSDLNLLQNYHTLALLQGDSELARSLKAKIDSADGGRGYDLYLLGREAMARKEFKEAERYLTKFLKFTPNFHPAWFELTRVHHELGNDDSAKSALRQAMELASQRDDINRYQAKLQQLKTAAR